jgi:phage gp36-like protein
MTYCTSSDVGSRLALDSAQRTRAANRLTSVINRATIDIDQEFRDYGRAAPTGATGTMADILKEICADIAAAYYLEDEAVFQTANNDGSVRSNYLRTRGFNNLQRLAHLGDVS